MSTTAPPIAALRPELTSRPERIKALPVFRGYPVPWFVAWINGEPEFRTADSPKWPRAVRDRLCWICGQTLGSYLAFVLGPMCGITRTTSEPACHRDCAVWSIRNCPFLTRPHMTRRDGNMPEGTVEAPGCALDRNPGVTLLWMTRGFSLFRDQDRRYLISVSDPIEVAWFSEGRQATREEIDASIASGLPFLVDIAVSEGAAAIADLERRVREFNLYFPVGATP